MNNLDKRYLKWPAVYPGNKRPVAGEVWRRFGNVDLFLEPFCGSCGVFWNRPLSHFRDGKAKAEILNDKSGHIVNFLRSLQADPKTLAEACNWPSSEIDLIARYRYLAGKGTKTFVKTLKINPINCDITLAAWWIWGLAQWIGADGFLKMNGDNWNKMPELQSKKGLFRPAKIKVRDKELVTKEIRIKKLVKWFSTLSNRLEYVNLVCGDWKRPLVSESLLRGINAGKVGVFLDPPYPIRTEEGISTDMYAKGDDLSELQRSVYHWCRKNGVGDVRVAVCGYKGDGYEKLVTKHGWTVFKWKTTGGFANVGGKGHESAGKENRHRERIWFSPNCLKPNTLF